MGDKSPKSKNKDSKQKQVKTAAHDQAKKKLVTDKQKKPGELPKKKK